MNGILYVEPQEVEPQRVDTQNVNIEYQNRKKGLVFVHKFGSLTYQKF